MTQFKCHYRNSQQLQSYLHHEACIESTSKNSLAVSKFWDCLHQKLFAMLFSRKEVSKGFMVITNSSPRLAQCGSNFVKSIFMLVYSLTYITQVEVTGTKVYFLLHFFYIQQTGFPIFFIVVGDWTLIHLESLKFSNRHHWSWRSKIISKFSVGYLFTRILSTAHFALFICRLWISQIWVSIFVGFTK